MKQFILFYIGILLSSTSIAREGGSGVSGGGISIREEGIERLQDLTGNRCSLIPAQESLDVETRNTLTLILNRIDSVHPLYASAIRSEIENTFICRLQGPINQAHLPRAGFQTVPLTEGQELIALKWMESPALLWIDSNRFSVVLKTSRERALFMIHEALHRFNGAYAPTRQLRTENATRSLSDWLENRISTIAFLNAWNELLPGLRFLSQNRTEQQARLIRNILETSDIELAQEIRPGLPTEDPNSLYGAETPQWFSAYAQERLDRLTLASRNARPHLNELLSFENIPNWIDALKEAPLAYSSNELTNIFTTSIPVEQISSFLGLNPVLQSSEPSALCLSVVVKKIVQSNSIEAAQSLLEYLRTSPSDSCFIDSPIHNFQPDSNIEGINSILRVGSPQFSIIGAIILHIKESGRDLNTQATWSRLITQFPWTPFDHDSISISPLSLAIQFDLDRIAEYLIHRGFSPNRVSSDSQSALERAIALGKISFIDRLWSISRVDSEHALNAAISSGQLPIFFDVYNRLSSSRRVFTLQHYETVIQRGYRDILRQMIRLQTPQNIPGNNVFIQSINVHNRLHISCPGYSTNVNPIYRITSDILHETIIPIRRRILFEIIDLLKEEGVPTCVFDP